jgi:ribosomal protein S18 acetylase RimI-like enzyme
MSLTEVDYELLDYPIWASLTGPHARFAEINGLAARFQPDVSPFTAVAPGAGDRAWADLAALVGPGAQVAVSGQTIVVPPGWELIGKDAGVQLIDVSASAAPDPEAVRLTAADVPEMLDLVGRAKPGPFLPRTIELGNYIGIRREGVLIAMAGERLRLPGWTEISAVCTDPAHRGQGLASRLVLAVADGIRQRGDTPLMHAAARNISAIRLYESLGFVLRRRTEFALVRTP